MWCVYIMGSLTLFDRLVIVSNIDMHIHLFNHVDTILCRLLPHLPGGGGAVILHSGPFGYQVSPFSISSKYIFQPLNNDIIDFITVLVCVYYVTFIVFVDNLLSSNSLPAISHLTRVYTVFCSLFLCPPVGAVDDHRNPSGDSCFVFDSLYWGCSSWR